MWQQTLDTVQEYNHQFWKEFRKAVKEANPEAIILAEHYGSPRGMAERRGMGYGYEL